LNWIDDFLHAPIGIKDNPPQPGAVVQFAQLALRPLTVCFLALAFLGLLTEWYRPKQIAIGVTAFAAWAVLAVTFAGLVLHRELIPGQILLWNLFSKAFGFLLALVLLAIYLLSVFAAIHEWSLSSRHKLVAVLMGLSAILAVPSSVGLYVTRVNNIAHTGILLAVVIFIVGVMAVPERAKTSDRASQPALDSEHTVSHSPRG
jgi:hypothetical protein